MSSNTEKFLSTLAFFEQPGARNPRAAWKTAERVLRENLEAIQKVPEDEVREGLAFAMTALLGHVHRSKGGMENLYLAVVTDDLHKMVHMHTCEQCRTLGEESHDTEDREEGPSGGPETLDLGDGRQIQILGKASSMGELLEKIQELNQPDVEDKKKN